MISICCNFDLHRNVNILSFGFVDFELSDVQQEHALAVERLAPALAALRMELCPEHMSESHFWMIYFVLLHPRLSKQDTELVSTPKVSWFYATVIQRSRF